MATRFSPGSLISSEPTRIQAPVSWAKGAEAGEARIDFLRHRLLQHLRVLGLQHGRHLGQHDELGAGAGRAADQRLEGGDAGRHVALGAVLHAGDAECLGHGGSPQGMDAEL